MSQNNAILGLDVGQVRIGLAIARQPVPIASPLEFLENNHDFDHKLNELIQQHDVTALVIGLPRNNNGQETDQTKYVQEFVSELQKTIKTKIYWQDESLTSVKAEKELQERGKPYQKGDIDSLAACYILSDYLEENQTW